MSIELILAALCSAPEVALSFAHFLHNREDRTRGADSGTESLGKLTPHLLQRTMFIKVERHYEPFNIVWQICCQTLFLQHLARSQNFVSARDCFNDLLMHNWSIKTSCVDLDLIISTEPQAIVQNQHTARFQFEELHIYLQAQWNIIQVLLEISEVINCMGIQSEPTYTLYYLKLRTLLLYLTSASAPVSLFVSMISLTIMLVGTLEVVHMPAFHSGEQVTVSLKRQQSRSAG